MTLLISQDRPSEQKYNLFHFILHEQLFKLTALDMKTALINENPRSQRTPRSPMSNYTSPSSSASMRSHVHLELAPSKKGTKTDHPPQDVDTFHLSSTTNLGVTCTLDTSCDHLLHLDFPSHSSDPQDTSSAESVEIEFIDEPEECLETNKSPTTDIFHEHHDYGLLLLNQEIDTPSNSVNHQDTHVCENQDAILIHATNLIHTFALPQFMAQQNNEHLNPTDNPSTVPTNIQTSSDHTFNHRCAHNPMATYCNQSQYPNPNHNFALPQFMAQPNCEDLDPTDNPSTVPTALQASSDHTFNPKSAHNLMETQCNQSQYLTSLNKICAHNPSASQNNQVSPSNSFASPYPPDPGEHVLKRFATEVGKKGLLLKRFKFIHPSPKPRMTETPVQKPAHVAYSPIASMNYQWTINLHDGYPFF